MPRKRLVLHDWNGCLLDDVPHRFEHGPQAILRAHGLPETTVEDYCQHITSDFMQWYYDRGIPDSGDRKADGDRLNAIMKANMARAPVPPLFPETVSFLRLLGQHGLVQTLVSALEEGEFRRQVGLHRLEEYFHEARGGIRKKAPVFRELLEKYGVDPEDAVGLTDTMSDARDLAEVGVTPVIVPRGYVVPDRIAVPTLVVADDLFDALGHII